MDGLYHNFQHPKKNVSKVPLGVCELLMLRMYHSFMISVDIFGAKTVRSRCLWSAMLSDGSHLLEI